MIETNTANLSELFESFPNENTYNCVKDSLLFYFSHLEFIKIKILQNYIHQYSIVLKENYNIEENFEKLNKTLENYKGWFVDLNK